jgi:hypothetical protein
MAGMGAAPKPVASRRRGLAQPLMQLPAAGRPGDPPAWPLGAQSLREELLWTELWSTPQAVAWEQIAATRVVGRYCRLLALAEHQGAIDVRGLLQETRQLEDRLGLSPMAMLRLRWQIAPDEMAEKRAESAAVDVRKRLRAVENG